MRSNEPHEKCIVLGCCNHKDEGRFEGPLCMCCYELLTTGKLNHGPDFVSEALRTLERIHAMTEAQ